MHRNPAMLYFFALNKSKTIQFYYSSPIIEIGIKPELTTTTLTEQLSVNETKLIPPLITSNELGFVLILPIIFLLLYHFTDKFTHGYNADRFKT